jgi:hypothetical protein
MFCGMKILWVELRSPIFCREVATPARKGEHTATAGEQVLIDARQ